MSTQQKYFFDKAGRQYRLTFESASFPTASAFNLAADSPVVISYEEGEHKYPGFRSVEMTIKIVSSVSMADFVPASALTTSVLLERGTQSGSTWTFSEVMFFGYLEPEAIDQSWRGLDDDFTLTAIDAVSAHKFTWFDFTRTAGIALLPFLTLPGSTATAVGSSYATRICAACGITQIRMMGYGESARYSWQCLESAFLPANFAVDSPDMSLPDVLAACCSLAGFTAIPWGKTLYLIDSLLQLQSSTWYRHYQIDLDLTASTYTSQAVTAASAVTNPLYALKTIAASDFRASDAKRSVIAAVAGVKIKSDRQDTGYAMPPLLEGATVTGGSVGALITVDSQQYYTERQRLSGTGIQWYCYRTDTGAELSDPTLSPSPSGVDWTGAVPIRCTHYKRGAAYDGVTVRDCIWVRLRPLESGASAPSWALFFRTAPAWRGQAYYRFRLKMKVATTTGTSLGRWYPPVLGSEGEQGVKDTIGRLYLCAGSDYYQRDNDATGYFYDGKWATDGNGIPPSFGSDGAYGIKSVNPSKTGVSFSIQESTAVSDWIGTVTPGSPMYLYYAGGDLTTAPALDLWLYDIEIEYDAAEIADSAWEYGDVHSEGYADVLTADCPVIGNYGAGHGHCYSNFQYYGAGVANRLPIAGFLGHRLAVRYASAHTAYQLSVGNDVQPWTLITIPDDSEAKTVDSMEWDVEDATRTVGIS